MLKFNGTSIIFSDNSEQTSAPSGIVSDVSVASGSIPIHNIISVTQAQYDAIISKDPNTLYVIT